VSVPTLPDWTAVGTALRAWAVAGSGLSADKVVYGQQDAPRPAAPAIVMRVSNIAETCRWVDEEDNPLVFVDKVVSAVDAAANMLTSVGHGLLTGDGPVRLDSSGAVPGGTLEDKDYWIIAPDADHVQVAATYVDTGGGQGGGNPTTPIDLIDAGSGTITIACTDNTRRAGQELLSITRGYLRVSLELRCHSVDATGPNTATAILERVRSRRWLPSQTARLEAANIGRMGVEHVSAQIGIRDAALFEPRASLIVNFNVPAQESEPLTIIESTEITDLMSDRVFVSP
jgi:hypothetical protein